jgi:predicted metal-dependent peptidase
MTFKGKSAEEIYTTLYVKKQKDQQGKQGAGPQPDPPPLVQVQAAEDPRQAETKTRVEVLQAAQAAKAMGDTTDGIISLAKQLVDEALPWEVMLRDFMERACKNDWTWKRPNRRYIQAGIYLPCMAGVEMGELVVGVDTSGSLSDAWLSKFGSEMAAIVEELKPAKVTVIYCDTKVHRVDEFEHGDDFELHAVGRGGTSFAPVFEYIEQEGITPAALVYFSDMECNRYGADPGCPVLWLSTGGLGYGRPPFGDVVRLSDGGLVMG